MHCPRSQLIFLNRLFLEQFQVHIKIEQKIEIAHICLLSPHKDGLPHYQHPYTSGKFVIINEPTMTHIITKSQLTWKLGFVSKTHAFYIISHCQSFFSIIIILPDAIYTNWQISKFCFMNRQCNRTIPLLTIK